jgi:hypothetical protein
VIFEFAAVCTKCGAPQRGALIFDEKMRLVDSGGGMLFNDGWRCEKCLDDVKPARQSKESE